MGHCVGDEVGRVLDRIHVDQRGGELTVDESVEDELAVLLNQVVDVAENATTRETGCVSFQELLDGETAAH